MYFIYAVNCVLLCAVGFSKFLSPAYYWNKAADSTFFILGCHIKKVLDVLTTVLMLHCEFLGTFLGAYFYGLRPYYLAR